MRNWLVLAVVLSGVGLTLRVYSQGVATRGATAAPRMAPSGKPYLVNFTDIAASVGLKARFVNGGETVKKYIIEANGAGVAFFDFDNDGWRTSSSSTVPG